MKKIIIILTIVLIVLVAAFYFLVIRKNDVAHEIAPEILPTGIIQPTQNIAQGELDIVGIKPIDFARNVGLDSAIEIEFSRSFTLDEINFYINPNTLHNSEIRNNKLIITPQNQWDVGTEYTHGVNFRDDDQKVRLYKFTTTGPTQEFLPDTQPEGLYDSERERQKNETPDIYVTNNSPYETSSFSLRADFEPSVPAHYYFIVTKKIADEQQVRQDVEAWMLGLGLLDAQIDALDIRYQ